MSEWLAYRLEDFLLFSPRVYWRMFELHNTAFWPLHPATFVAGLAITLFMLRRPQNHGLWVALILAVLWAFVGWSFLWSRYAAINWAVAYVAPAFGLQGLLLTIATVGGLTFDRNDITARLGLLLAVIGLFAYPLLPLLFVRPWTGAEAFGVAPDPTAITTLGVLLAARGRLVPLLFPIPLLWLLMSGLTLRHGRRAGLAAAFGCSCGCPPDPASSRPMMLQRLRHTRPRAMPGSLRYCPLAAALLLIGAVEASAHAFPRPYDLPLPHWLVGAGIAVALSFVAAAGLIGGRISREPGPLRFRGSRRRPY